MKRLDAKGRCCGRKPIYYRGGSWCSPMNCPMHFCDRCDREYGPDGVQRDNWAWNADGSRKVWRDDPIPPEGIPVAPHT